MVVAVIIVVDFGTHPPPSLFLFCSLFFLLKVIVLLGFLNILHNQKVKQMYSELNHLDL